MQFSDQGVLLVLIRLPVGQGISDHHKLLIPTGLKTLLTIFHTAYFMQSFHKVLQTNKRSCENWHKGKNNYRNILMQ